MSESQSDQIIINSDEEKASVGDHIDQFRKELPDLIHSPFDGVDYFKYIDEEKVEAVEEGEKGKPGWMRYEYYPRVGHVRILKQRDNHGRPEIFKWTYECRTRFGMSSRGSLQPDDAPIIDQGITKLKEKGVDIIKPIGFPEVENVIEAAVNTPEINLTDLTEGSYYLVFGHRRKRIVYKHGSLLIEDFSRRENRVVLTSMSDEIFGANKHLELTESNEPKQPTINGNIALATAIPKDSYRYQENDERLRIYQLSEEQTKAIADLRPAVEDPYVGTEYTRERLSIIAALQGLQYERWGKDEVDYNPERYENVTRENYQKALETVIYRFGEESFASEVETLFKSHLHMLHTNKHLEGSPYLPHSDISPLGADLMELASQVIKGLHPLPENMTESGHVVNVKTLFGDADFWNLMRVHHKDLYNRFVDYLAALPRDYEQHGMYAIAIVDPVALIKQYFPQAYSEIAVGRPDFDSDTPEAIHDVKSNRI